MTVPRICHAGNASDCGIAGEKAARCAELGFSHFAVAQPRQHNGEGALQTAREACDAAQLSLLLEMVVTDLPLDHPLVREHPECFSFTADATASYVDPRLTNLVESRAISRPQLNPEPFIAWWSRRLRELSAMGANGFCFADPQVLEPPLWHELIDRTRSEDAPLVFIADTSQAPREITSNLYSAGFDYIVSALPRWNGRAAWLVEEHATAAATTPAIALVESPFREPPASCEMRRARLAAAAVIGAGVMMPFGFESEHCDGEIDGLTVCVQAMNSIVQSLPGFGGLRSLTGAGDPITILLRTDCRSETRSRSALLAVINPDPTLNAIFDERYLPALGEWSVLEPVEPFAGTDGQLAPGEARVYRAARRKPIVVETRSATGNARAAAQESRVWIGHITPSVDSGRYPAKAVVGEIVTIATDLITDGHGLLAAELHFRADDERNWHRVAMKGTGNDRWEAMLHLKRVGRYRFMIEAWLDIYGSFVRDLARKRAAGIDITLDVEEGRELIHAQAARSDKSVRSALTEIVDAFSDTDPVEHAAILMAPETIEAMARADPRERKAVSAEHCIEAERRVARFGNWYELFPRSQSTVSGRHGTFRDVIARLPAIAAMGFDVLYLTPIHPIGTTNRKGRNNELISNDGDPGSTYAIGAAAGGHTAVHPELGTLTDFHELVHAAEQEGMEIALDFAAQCSPDHPWLNEHPGWFDWRPDGTIKYAENPPKRYEDIVNVDFYAREAIPGLWLALRDVVLFWIKQGVRIFRVDNPHTKPFAFWQWLLSDIRRNHPDVVFLSEAFTRPKLMYHLAKLGFSQSYTYFTWRNTKRELMSYVAELNSTPIAWYFRPNFFVNTPDINPWYLQHSGRPGFIIRAALAATLAGSWGICSGFELCEADALPNREEYRDSEKYELKFRDWNAPGNIIREITRLNRLRRSEPAFQTHLGTTFYNAHNDNILYFGRHTERSADRILVAISLNPHGAEECDFEIPLWEWGLPDTGALLAHDLMRGGSFVWHGKMQRMGLSPEAPIGIWRISPAEVS